MQLAAPCSAQFIDPGFEGETVVWPTTHPAWTSLTPSDAPYGGVFCMAVRAESQNFQEHPFFYQALPAATIGDPVTVDFSCRPSVPSGGAAVMASAMIRLLSINSAGTPTILDGYQVNLGMAWTASSITFTVPALQPGSTFGVGFGGYCFQGQDCYLLYDNVHASIEGSGARLNAKAWLDGAYVHAQNLMRDDLRSAGLVPTTEANGTAMETWQHLSGGETTTAAVLATSGPNAIVDWVRIELRMGMPTDSLTYRMRNALIQRDGDIVDVDGVSPVLLPVKAGNYYVLIRHRNHLSVMSAVPLTLTSTPTLFDTRSPATAVFLRTGAATGPALRSVGATRTLWAGNTRDTLWNKREVLYTGNGNDRDRILLDIAGMIPTNTRTGYFRTDVNLDGVVKYTGSNNDRDLILQTIGGVVPTAVRHDQVP